MRRRYVVPDQQEKWILFIPNVSTLHPFAYTFQFFYWIRPFVRSSIFKNVLFTSERKVKTNQSGWYRVREIRLKIPVISLFATPLYSNQMVSWAQLYP